jgi:hypothetical protein
VPADLSRISVTAKVAAYYRQFSDIAFAGEVATRIGADDAFEQILREHGLERDKLTFYAPMFEARYKSISQLIGTSGCSQVLELASGYSLRGLDLTQSSAVRYVEADLPDVVATKLTLLDDVRRQHGLPPSPLHVVTVADALDFEQVRTAAGGLDHGLPLMVLCEGLIGYLTREETERLASNVRALLGAFGGGWWICPDFSFRAEVGVCRPRGSDCVRPSPGSPSVSWTPRRSRTTATTRPSSPVSGSTCGSGVRSTRLPRCRPSPRSACPPRGPSACGRSCACGS